MAYKLYVVEWEQLIVQSKNFIGKTIQLKLFILLFNNA